MILVGCKLEGLSALHHQCCMLEQRRFVNRGDIAAVGSNLGLYEYRDPG